MRIDITVMSLLNVSVISHYLAQTEISGSAQLKKRSVPILYDSKIR